MIGLTAEESRICHGAEESSSERQLQMKITCSKKGKIGKARVQRCKGVILEGVFKRNLL